MSLPSLGCNKPKYRSEHEGRFCLAVGLEMGAPTRYLVSAPTTTRSSWRGRAQFSLGTRIVHCGMNDHLLTLYAHNEYVQMRRAWDHWMIIFVLLASF